MSDFFDIDPSSGEFIFCAIEGENENGNLQTLQKKVDLKKVMHRIPDTASSMFSSEKRYRKYTTDEPENPSED